MSSNPAMLASASFENIKVEVISNGQSLPFYDDPDGTENVKQCTRQNYIEAVTDATFSVKVTLNEAFEMGHCDIAAISMSFDGGGNEVTGNVNRGSGLKNRPLRDRQVIFSSVPHFWQSSGQWMHGKLCFGQLTMTETSGSEATPVQIQELGQIRLKIVRIMKGKIKIATSPSKHPISRIGEVSEKVMKGKAISNTIDFVDYMVGREPRPIFKAHPIDGPLGRSLHWNILYRSRSTLQMLGCIPRTPFPDLEATAQPRRSGSLNPVESKGVGADQDEEVRNLRAQLTHVESQAKIKPENGNNLSGVKRECDDRTSTGPRKKSRGSTSIEIVDLTAD